MTWHACTHEPMSNFKVHNPSTTLHVHAKSLQTLCDTMDHSSSVSSVHGIFQARILEWVAILSSRGSSRPRIEPASLKSPALVSVFFTTWRRKWQPTPIFLPGEFHGQRSLVGCSPWGGKELDMTEQLILSLPLPPPENPTLNHPTSLNQVLISAWMLDMSTST